MSMKIGIRAWIDFAFRKIFGKPDGAKKRVLTCSDDRSCLCVKCLTVAACSARRHAMMALSTHSTRIELRPLFAFP